MRKIYLILLFLLLLGNVHNVHSEGIKSEGWYDVNKLYLDNGYNEISEVVGKAEVFLGENIELPTRLPPITFTHMLGKFEENGEYSRLEVTYLDENSGNVRYKILISRIFSEDSVLKSNVASQRIKLSDGNEIIYYKNDKKLDTFIVKKKGFEYAFFIDKISVNKITVDGIIEIIDSMR